MKKDKKKSNKPTDSEEIIAKSEEYLAGWKRALADYENLKRDLAQSKAQDRARIKESFAFDLLPVIDNFEQAMNHVPKDVEKNHASWLTGVSFIRKQFEDVMSSLGVEPIEVGSIFDPNMHDAAGEDMDKTKKDGEILKVMQSGWRMGEKIIRPAKVVINNLEK